MKKYIIPRIKITVFDSNIAAAVSAADGVDLTEKALNTKQITAVQKAKLSAFEFIY